MRIQESEADVQRACLDWLNCQRGVKVWRRNVGGVTRVYRGKERFIRFAAAGMSDIEGVARGRHVEIEIKKRGQKPTETQDAWLSDMQHLGAVAFWCDSLDKCIAQFEAYMRQSQDVVDAFRGLEF